MIHNGSVSWSVSFFYQSLMSAQEVFKKGWVPQVQGQVRPGLHCKLNPPPIVDVTADGHPYKPAGKMIGKTAIVTGGDSGALYTSLQRRCSLS